jgi:predicted amidophosphoribosyltransferase
LPSTEHERSIDLEDLSSCDAPIDEGSRFCSRCGASLAQALAAGHDTSGAHQPAKDALAVFERLVTVCERDRAAELLTRVKR